VNKQGLVADKKCEGRFCGVCFRNVCFLSIVAFSMVLAVCHSRKFYRSKEKGTFTKAKSSFVGVWKCPKRYVALFLSAVCN